MAFAVAERARHPLDPPKVGAILSTLAQASHVLRTAQLLHPASTAGISPHAPGISLPGSPACPWTRTLTGWLSSACRLAMSWQTSCHGTRSAGRTPRKVDREVVEGTSVDPPVMRM